MPGNIPGILEFCGVIIPELLAFHFLFPVPVVLPVGKVPGEVKRDEFFLSRLELDTDQKSRHITSPLRRFFAVLDILHTPIIRKIIPEDMRIIPPSSPVPPRLDIHILFRGDEGQAAELNILFGTPV
ncbi:hypothetical protein ES703_106073 [subsurface metagenome]